MNEIDQKDVMTGRKWIEFGKMWNNLACSGWECILESNNINGDITYNVSFFPDCDEMAGECIDDLVSYSTPYEAMKRMYFTHFLDKPETEEVNFDFPPEFEAELYAQADKEGITIDEVVTNILKQMIEPVQEEVVKEVPVTEISLAKCCYNCDYLKRGLHTICMFYPYPTETQREYTCKNFHTVE